jgi:ACS family tartrate transporter-like MFS transporter
VNERRFHVAASWGFGAAALLLLPLALRSFSAGFAVLVLAAVGTYGAEGVAVSHYMALQGGEKGIGMAIVNSAGALGGFAGPLLIGALKQRSGGYASSMFVLGAFLSAAAISVGLLNPEWAGRWMMRTGPDGRLGDVEAAGGGGGGGGARREGKAAKAATP